MVKGPADVAKLTRPCRQCTFFAAVIDDLLTRLGGIRYDSPLSRCSYRGCWSLFHTCLIPNTRVFSRSRVPRAH